MKLLSPIPANPGGSKFTVGSVAGAVASISGAVAATPGLPPQVTGWAAVLAAIAGGIAYKFP